MTRRTSCDEAYVLVVVTMAPHRFDRHCEFIEQSCGHFGFPMSSIDDVEAWIAQRFLPVPRRLRSPSRRGR